jgi:general secretion pathway protein E
MTDTAAPPQPDSRWVPPGVLERIPRDFARRHLLLPQQTEAGPVLLRARDGDGCAAHNLLLWLGESWPAVDGADSSAVASAIDAAYESEAAARPSGASAGSGSAQDIEALPVGDASLENLLRHAERDLLSTAGKAPLVRLVDALLFEAVSKGASDLHLQPLSDRIIVRHRVDGVLDQGRVLSLGLLKPILSRIKVMSGMDVAEHLLPQDGRTSVRIGDRTCDVRVSTLPTPHGERVVLRLLDASRQLQSFADLGMPAALSEVYLAAARRSSGIILVTGPTGSGKTTTLYATLRELDSHERNIMTVEDPIDFYI